MCFMVALLNIELRGGFDFDPNLIGRMALVVGGGMMLQALLHFMIYYRPLNQVPRQARCSVIVMFLGYVICAAAVMGVAVVTGIGRCFLHQILHKD